MANNNKSYSKDKDLNEIWKAEALRQRVIRDSVKSEKSHGDKKD